MSFNLTRNKCIAGYQFCQWKSSLTYNFQLKKKMNDNCIIINTYGISIKLRWRGHFIDTLYFLFVFYFFLNFNIKHLILIRMSVWDTKIHPITIHEYQKYFFFHCKEMEPHWHVCKMLHTYCTRSSYFIQPPYFTHSHTQMGWIDEKHMQNE